VAKSFHIFAEGRYLGDKVVFERAKLAFNSSITEDVSYYWYEDLYYWSTDTWTDDMEVDMEDLEIKVGGVQVVVGVKIIF